MKYNKVYLENRINHTLELVEILLKEKIISLKEYDNLFDLIDEKTDLLLKQQED